MTRHKSNDYQKRFIRLSLSYLPHHLALYVAVRLHISVLRNWLNAYAKTRIVGPFALPSISKPELDNYTQATGQTALWHGTGRYQHSGAQIIDVLESIIRTRALRPIEDAYAIFGGGQLMKSISLTKLRIVARSYADMYGKGFREPNRYGDAMTWTAYYYGLFYARLYGLHYPTVKNHYKTWHSLTHDEKGHNTWGKKVSSAAEDVWDAFGLGSDIPDNYPIIIGLRHLEDIVPLPRFFGDYEVRVAKQIKLEEITHLEVPATKVDEVTRALKSWQVSIPVQAIEAGELIASQQDFNVLVGLER